MQAAIQIASCLSESHQTLAGVTPNPIAEAIVSAAPDVDVQTWASVKVRGFQLEAQHFLRTPLNKGLGDYWREEISAYTEPSIRPDSSTTLES